VRLERLGQLKKTSGLIGNRTHDLPACTIVPQSTTLPRATNVLNDTVENLSRSVKVNKSVFCLRMRVLQTSDMVVGLKGMLRVLREGIAE
jgi:hypothetical protein